MEPGLGFKILPKEKIDSRDKFFFSLGEDSFIPTSVDNRKKCGPIMNQGQTNSCVGHSLASVADMRAVWNDNIFRMFSPTFSYWCARDYEKETDKDEGAYIFDAVKAYNKLGIAPEKLCRFEDGVFKKPDWWATSFAKFFMEKPEAYYKITDANMDGSFVDDVKIAIAKGYTVVGGIYVADSFFHPSAGVVLPKNVETFKGGHALHWIGYVDLDDAQYQEALKDMIGFEMILNEVSKYPKKQGFLIFKNSWGSVYGNSGYGMIPYDYVDTYGNDFWALK